MAWTLFEGQLLNLDRFIRFYVKGKSIFGLISPGYRIRVKEYADRKEARNGLIYLLARMEKLNGNITTQADQSR